MGQELSLFLGLPDDPVSLMTVAPFALTGAGSFVNIACLSGTGESIDVP